MLRNDTAPTPLALLDDPLAYVLAASFWLVSARNIDKVPQWPTRLLRR